MKAKKERPFGTTSGGERLVYALGDLGSNFVWTFCSSFLTLYYTDSVLVSAGLVGTKRPKENTARRVRGSAAASSRWS